MYHFDSKIMARFILTKTNDKCKSMSDRFGTQRFNVLRVYEPIRERQPPPALEEEQHALHSRQVFFQYKEGHGDHPLQ